MPLKNAIICFSSELVVTREKTGYYIKGRYQESTPDETTIKASIQPVSGQERLMLPEGIRSRQVIKIYTPFLLKTANAEAGTKADYVEYNDCTFDIISVEDWTEHGGYYKAIAARSGR